MPNRSFAATAGLKMPPRYQDNPWQVARRFAAIFPGKLDDATLDRIAKAASGYPKQAKRDASPRKPKDALPRLRPDDLHVMAHLLAEASGISGYRLAAVFGRSRWWTQQAITRGLVLVLDRRAEVMAEVEASRQT